VQAEVKKTCVISYPKSGRTWLKALIGYYLEAKRSVVTQTELQGNSLSGVAGIFETERITKEAGLSETSFTHAGSDLSLQVKASDYHFPDDMFREAERLVILSREIKDTLVSAYFQSTHKLSLLPKSTKLEDFIADESCGLPKIVSFYKCLHKSRSLRRESSEILFITYEGLQENTPKELVKILKFIGEEQPLEAAVEYACLQASFAQMRQLEMNITAASIVETMRSDASTIVSVAPTVPLIGGVCGYDPSTDKVTVVEDSLKVRKGIVGGYKNYLDEDQWELVNHQIQSAGIGSFGKL
jgi:hypothetical protein